MDGLLVSLVVDSIDQLDFEFYVTGIGKNPNRHGVTFVFRKICLIVVELIRRESNRPVFPVEVYCYRERYMQFIQPLLVDFHIDGGIIFIKEPIHKGIWVIVLAQV